MCEIGRSFSVPPTYSAVKAHTNCLNNIEHYARALSPNRLPYQNLYFIYMALLLRRPLREHLAGTIGNFRALK